LVRAYCGLGDRERLGSGSGPHDHPVRHALLGASVAVPDPLGLAFLGRPFMAIGRGTGSTLSSGKGPLLGLSLSSSRPSSGELVGFWGTSPERSSIEGSGCSVWGAGVAPEVIVGPLCQRAWWLLGTTPLMFYATVDGVWGAAPGRGVMVCTPAPSHFI
jgi:hypothetical protein